MSRLLLVSLIPLATAIGCGVKDTHPVEDTALNEGNESGTGGSGSAELSYAADILPIFEAATCTSGYCHGDGTDNGGFSLDGAPASFVNQPSSAGMVYVEPGSPENSYLMYKLMGTQADVGGGGVQMPADRPPLSEAELDTIESWILSGAAD